MKKGMAKKWAARLVLILFALGVLGLCGALLVGGVRELVNTTPQDWVVTVGWVVGLVGFLALFYFGLAGLARLLEWAWNEVMS